MRGRMLLITALAALFPAATARAQGDPIMPLSEVEPGMECTGYSVFRGTSIDTFDVEIVDLVGGESGARLLVRVSGPAVDETGIGAGFSGSPIYCPASDGQMKNAGAISETIGDYGGKTVLATPIEQIVGTPVDGPAAPEEPTAASAERSQARTDGSFGGSARARAARDRSIMSRARTIASPITVGGLSSRVFAPLAAAARRKGIALIQAPPEPSQPAPFQPFRPGSAVSVGLSSGDVSVGAVGTVAYVDGEKTWLFGHSFDAVGRRSLLLQDAYVAAIIGNPVQLPDIGGTYKLAGAMNDVGTTTNDEFNAVAGRAGPLPPMVPVRVFATDEDTGASTTTAVDVADETDVGSPAGPSGLSFVGPLTVTQAATGVLGSQPLRLAGEMCLRVVLREREKPLRVCNRYVADGTTGDPSYGNIVALTAGTDAAEVLALIDTYKRSALHVSEVGARIRMTRAQRQAYMRSVRLPRRVRPGSRVKARMVVEIVRGKRRTIEFRMRIPRNLGAGRKRLQFRGSEPDTGDDFFGDLVITLGEPGDQDLQGPRTLGALVREIRKVQRYDGIRLRKRHVYRHPELRIGGRATATVRVVR